MLGLGGLGQVFHRRPVLQKLGGLRAFHKVVHVGLTICHGSFLLRRRYGYAGPPVGVPKFGFKLLYVPRQVR